MIPPLEMKTLEIKNDAMLKDASKTVPIKPSNAYLKRSIKTRIERTITPPIMKPFPLPTVKIAGVFTMLTSETLSLKLEAFRTASVCNKVCCDAVLVTILIEVLGSPSDGA